MGQHWRCSNLIGEIPADTYPMHIGGKAEPSLTVSLERGKRTRLFPKWALENGDSIIPQRNRSNNLGGPMGFKGRQHATWRNTHPENARFRGPEPAMQSAQNQRKTASACFYLTYPGLSCGLASSKKPSTCGWYGQGAKAHA